MSEYQYYEFVAVDGPISDEGMRYAHGCSSRAEVSRFRWTNEYHFGEFHGDAEILLKYYDAHFYIANWGSVRAARLKKKAEIEEAELIRKAAQRKRDLESVMKRADKIWTGLDSLMDQKVAAAYDDAAKQLSELRAAYQQAGQESVFQNRLDSFRVQYAHRPAMMRRIDSLAQQ